MNQLFDYLDTARLAQFVAMGIALFLTCFSLYDTYKTPKHER